METLIDDSTRNKNLAERIFEEMGFNKSKVLEVIEELGHDKVLFIYKKFLKEFNTQKLEKPAHKFKEMLDSKEFDLEFRKSLVEPEQENLTEVKKELAPAVENFSETEPLKNIVEVFKQHPEQVEIISFSLTEVKVDKYHQLAKLLKLATGINRPLLLDDIARQILESCYNAFFNDKVYGVKQIKLNTQENQEIFRFKLKQIKDIIDKLSFENLLNEFLRVNYRKYKESFADPKIKDFIIEIWEKV